MILGVNTRVFSGPDPHLSVLHCKIRQAIKVFASLGISLFMSEPNAPPQIRDIKNAHTRFSLDIDLDITLQYQHALCFARKQFVLDFCVRNLLFYSYGRIR